MSQAPSPAETSPLAEAIPDSISELFSRDPKALTDADLDRIVAELRTQRQRYIEAEQRTGKTPRGVSKAPKPTPRVLTLDEA